MTGFSCENHKFCQMKSQLYNVFFWRDPSALCLNTVRDSIAHYTEGSLPVVLCCSSAFDLPASEVFPSVQAYLLDQCRTSGLLPNERTTYYSPRDHVLALRLAIDATGKNEPGNNSVTGSDVSYCHRLYTKHITGQPPDGDRCAKAVHAYREFLDSSNAINDWTLGVVLSRHKDRLEDCLTKGDLLILGHPTGAKEMCLLKLLVGKRNFHMVTIETALDASFCNSSPGGKSHSTQVQLLESGWECVDEPADQIPTIPHHNSAGQLYAEEVFLAFLRLAVNIRDELALLKSLMSVLVNLPQDAFLHLKRSASRHRISVCQAALSYIRRVQLGGQSYAPATDCPLRPHIKELTAFSHLLDKVQTIAEEEKPSVSAVKRIISTIANRMLKCCEGTIRPENVQLAASRLNSVTDYFGKSSVGPVLHYAGTVRLIQRVLDHGSSRHLAPPFLISGFTGSKNGTPVPGPSPFTYFRTPEEIEAELIPSISERLSTENIQTPVCSKKFKAGLPWGDDPHQEKEQDLNSEPSHVKTISGQDEMHSSTPKCVTTRQDGPKRGGVKRSILTDITNQNTLLPSESDPTAQAIRKKQHTSRSEEISNTSKNKYTKDNKRTALSEKTSFKKKQKEIPKGQASIRCFFQKIS